MLRIWLPEPFWKDSSHLSRCSSCQWRDDHPPLRVNFPMKILIFTPPVLPYIEEFNSNTGASYLWNQRTCRSIKRGCPDIFWGYFKAVPGTGSEGHWSLDHNAAKKWLDDYLLYVSSISFSIWKYVDLSCNSIKTDNLSIYILLIWLLDWCLDSDGFHLATEGSKIVAKEIMRALEEAEWEPSLYWKLMPSEFVGISPFDSEDNWTITNSNMFGEEDPMPWIIFREKCSGKKIPCHE